MSLDIERTFDAGVIKEVFAHPVIYPLICEDGSPEREHFEPSLNESLIYLAIYENGSLAAVMFAHPINATCYECHTNILPKFWGKDTACYTKLAMNWMFENTKANILQATIPETAHQVIKHVEKLGFIPIGIRPNSITKQGKQLNELLFYYQR